MSRKSNLLKFHNIVAGDLSTTITSAVTSIQWLDNIGVQLNITTSSASGTFTVQVSADYAQDELGNVQNAGNWVPILFPTPPITTGVNETIYIDLNQLSAPWIRVVYTPTSGTGTIDGYITGKVC